MGILDKILKKFSFYYCRQCKQEMALVKKQLYLTQMYVRNEAPTTIDEESFIKTLTPIRSKKEVPTGMYACGARVHECQGCNKRVESLELLLPVMDKEVTERYYIVSEGTLNRLEWLD